MRPSNEAFRIAVLDTRPELEVVLTYIQSSSYLRGLPASNQRAMEGLAPARELINPIGDAFFYKATSYDVKKHRSVIKEGAEYPLNAVEASIALAGAKWVVARRNPISRLKNTLSGRKDAAKDMIEYLSGLDIQPWDGVEQLQRPQEYQAKNWNNFGRRLTRKEFSEIEARVSGLHFAKETFADDPITKQALFAAEALMREVQELLPENPFTE